MIKFKNMILGSALVIVAALAAAQPAPPVDESPAAIRVADESAATTGALAQAPPSAADSASPAGQWLRKIEKAFADTKTVKGKFEQTLVNDLFSETIEARGDFYFQKERQFRANHELKEDGKWVKDNELIISNDMLWIYSPVLEQVEIFRISASANDEAGRLHQMFLGFGPKTEEVLQAYKVTVEDEARNAVTLKFVPMDETIAADLQFVEITFDVKELLPRKVMWLTPDENRTTIELKGIERNARLPGDIFKPEFPPNTAILERN